MSSLLVFNRVYRPEIQSVMLVFSTQLALLTPKVHLPPPPPLPFPKSKYIKYRQCSAGRGFGGCWVVLETIFCRSLTLCIWPDTEPTKIALPPQKKPRRGGARKVPLQVNLTLLSIFLIFLRFRTATQTSLSPYAIFHWQIISQTQNWFFCLLYEDAYHRHCPL